MWEVGWASRELWPGKQNLARPGIRTADRPSHGDSTEIGTANINGKMLFLFMFVRFLILLWIVLNIHHQITVIPRLTKIIRFGITFVSRNLR